MRSINEQIGVLTEPHYDKFVVQIRMSCADFDSAKLASLTLVKNAPVNYAIRVSDPVVSFTARRARVWCLTWLHLPARALGQV